MKKNSKIIISIILFAALITASGLYLANKPIGQRVKDEITQVTTPPFNPTTPDKTETTQALLNVPFTSQAPTGNWADPRQENGCEEASMLMANLWLNNKSLTPTEAEKQIIAISDYEASHGAYTPDIDAQTVTQLFKDYFGYQKVSFTLNPTIQDIKSELMLGHLVLVPANGQKLDNPHYKSPGPFTHMLVIKGFNDSKGEFITNDPGTKYGLGYVYSYEKLYNAMVDYPTGDHGSQVGRPKAMIVVSK